LKNLFDNLPVLDDEEVINELLSREGVRIGRKVNPVRPSSSSVAFGC
jgi:hypothetical protein